MNKNLKDMLFLILPLVFFAWLWLFTRNNQDLHREPVGNKVVSLQSQDLDGLIEEKDVFLLDVHTPEQKHIAGTDAFIPFDKIGENLSELPEDKNTPILVYCRSGSMSKLASEELISLGYKEVYDLVGGIQSYRETHVNVDITPTVQDLGEVVYGDVERTEFDLINNTSKPLKITRVSTSCGCTKAELEKKILEPYEATKIKVSFDPAVHKDDTDLGQLTRIIYIETDNQNFAKLSVEITANVVKK